MTPTLKRRTLTTLAKLVAHTLDRFPLLDRAVAAAMRDIERERVCSIEITQSSAEYGVSVPRTAVARAMIGTSCPCADCRAERLEIN